MKKARKEDRRDSQEHVRSKGIQVEKDFLHRQVSASRRTIRVPVHCDHFRLAAIGVSLMTPMAYDMGRHPEK